MNTISHRLDFIPSKIYEKTRFKCLEIKTDHHNEIFKLFNLEDRVFLLKWV